jgi:ribosomal protein L4
MLPTEEFKEAVSAFNKLYKIGTELIVVDDFGAEHVRTLKSEAWIIGTNQAIAIFEGISCGLDIRRVKHKMKYKSNDVAMSYLVPCDANGVAV